MKYKTEQELQDTKELLSPPGDTIAEIIEARSLPLAEFAQQMEKSSDFINNLVKGEVEISLALALQLEQVLNITADFGRERERRYRLELSEISLAEKANA